MLYAGPSGGHQPEPASTKDSQRAQQVPWQDIQCLAHRHPAAGIPCHAVSPGKSKSPPSMQEAPSQHFVIVVSMKTQCTGWYGWLCLCHQLVQPTWRSRVQAYPTSNSLVRAKCWVGLLPACGTDPVCYQVCWAELGVMLPVVTCQPTVTSTTCTTCTGPAAAVACCL